MENKSQHYVVVRNGVEVDIKDLSHEELLEELKKTIDVIYVLEDKSNEMSNLINKWFSGRWFNKSR
jgi:hypothetical protein